LNNYPVDKPRSNIDIHLPDGTADDEYLSRLNAGLSSALAEFHPDLIVYVAGADPYEQDQLGGLALTMTGLQRRDRLVLREALRRSIPVAIVLAGGYAFDVRDTVSIHVNTAKAARDLLLPL
ncbi:MAG: histone deacetylase family protein, partial [Bryobacteraceae bacterium]